MLAIEGGYGHYVPPPVDEPVPVPQPPTSRSGEAAVLTQARNHDWAGVEAVAQHQFEYGAPSNLGVNADETLIGAQETQYIGDGPADSNYQAAIMAAASVARNSVSLANTYKHAGAVAFTAGFKSVAGQMPAQEVAALLKDPLLQTPLKSSIQGAMTPGDDLTTSTKTVTRFLTGGRSAVPVRETVTTHTSYAGTVIENLAAVSQVAFNNGSGSAAVNNLAKQFLAVTPARTYAGGRGLYYDPVGGGTAESGLTSAVENGNSALASALMAVSLKPGSIEFTANGSRPDFIQFGATAEKAGLVGLESAGTAALTNFRTKGDIEYAGLWEDWGKGLPNNGLTPKVQSYLELHDPVQYAAANAAATTLTTTAAATYSDYQTLSQYAPALAGVQGWGPEYTANFSAAAGLAGLKSSTLGSEAAGTTPSSSPIASTTPDEEALSDYRWALRSTIGAAQTANAEYSVTPISGEDGPLSPVLTVIGQGVNSWRVAWLWPQSSPFLSNREYTIPLSLNVAAGLRKAMAQVMLSPNGVTSRLGIKPGTAPYDALYPGNAKVLGKNVVTKILGKDAFLEAVGQESPAAAKSFESVIGKYGWDRVGFAANVAWTVGDSANAVSDFRQALAASGQEKAVDFGQSAAFALSAVSDVAVIFHSPIDAKLSKWFGSEGLDVPTKLASGDGAAAVAAGESSLPAAEDVLASLAAGSGDGVIAAAEAAADAGVAGAAEGSEAGPWTAVGFAAVQVIASLSHTVLNDLGTADANNFGSTEYLEAAGVNSNIAGALAEHDFDPLSAKNGSSAGPAISGYLMGHWKLTNGEMIKALNTMNPTQASEFRSAASEIAQNPDGSYEQGSAPPAIVSRASIKEPSWMIGDPTTFSDLDTWVSANIPQLGKFLQHPTGA